MMRTAHRTKPLTRRPLAVVSIPTRLLSLLLLAALTPLGLLFAGLIWLEDGGPVFTGSRLECMAGTLRIPSFRVATLHLEEWDIRKLPATVGKPERLILIPTLTVIGRILTLLHLDRLPAMLLVAQGQLTPDVLFRSKVIYSA